MWFLDYFIIRLLVAFWHWLRDLFNGKKTPNTAAALSFFLFGGAGQIYLGQWKKGLALISATLLLDHFISNLIGLPIGFILISIAGIGDAYGIAEKLNDGKPIREWEFNINWKISSLVAIIYTLVIGGLIFFFPSA